MKIFLDTNILLDLLLERENFKEAMIILNSVERGIYEAFEQIVPNNKGFYVRAVKVLSSVAFVDGFLL